MERAAEEAGIHRRTMVRLENDAGYVERQPASLRRLVEAYRARRILLEGEGLSIAGCCLGLGLTRFGGHPEAFARGAPDAQNPCSVYA